MRMEYAPFAIAFFAAVQIAWVVYRHVQSRSALKHKTIAPAWLARRSLEEDLRSIFDRGVIDWQYHWSINRGRIDRIETQLREVLQLSADVGGKFKEKGRKAFAAWIGFADVANSPVQGDQHSQENVIDCLFAAINALGEIHPRETSEPEVPTLAEVTAMRQLGGQGEGPARPV